jgi:hypothetical protein
VNNPSPSRIMLIAGGAVLFIASFLKWRDTGISEGGLSTDWTGLQGIFCLLIGAAIAVLVALQTFGSVNLPARVLGFTWTQLYLMFGLATFLITFGLQFSERTAFGITLGWIASAVIVAGAFMELQTEGRAAGGTTPPKPF